MILMHFLNSRWNYMPCFSKNKLATKGQRENQSPDTGVSQTTVQKTSKPAVFTSLDDSKKHCG